MRDCALLGLGKMVERGEMLRAFNWECGCFWGVEGDWHTRVGFWIVERSVAFRRLDRSRSKV